MTRKLIILAVLAALFALPGVAQAGCQAYPAQPYYSTANGALYAIGTIGCSTNNGSHYQMRSYLQTNDGGWHILAGVPAYVNDFYSPPNGFTRDVLEGFWLCQSIAPAATQVRQKLIVENMVSLQKDTEYSTAYTIASSCHY